MWQQNFNHICAVMKWEFVSLGELVKEMCLWTFFWKCINSTRKKLSMNGYHHCKGPFFPLFFISSTSAIRSVTGCAVDHKILQTTRPEKKLNISSQRSLVFIFCKHFRWLYMCKGWWMKSKATNLGQWLQRKWNSRHYCPTRCHLAMIYQHTRLRAVTRFHETCGCVPSKFLAAVFGACRVLSSLQHF